MEDKTLKQLFEVFEKANKNMDDLLYLFNTMSRNLDANNKVESMEWVADANNIVMNRAYTINSPGGYRIITEGFGKASYSIKDSSGLKEYGRDAFDDNAKSDILFLGHGDLVYVHVSPDPGHTMKLTLIQEQSLFELVSDRLEDMKREMSVLNSRLDVLVHDYGVNAYVEEDSETLVINSSLESVEE